MYPTCFYPPSGFGLFICKSIVDVHRGQLTVTSDGEGKGSVFCLQLPMRRASPAAVVHQSESLRVDFIRRHLNDSRSRARLQNLSSRRPGFVGSSSRRADAPAAASAASPAGISVRGGPVVGGEVEMGAVDAGRRGVGSRGEEVGPTQRTHPARPDIQPDLPPPSAAPSAPEPPTNLAPGSLVHPLPSVKSGKDGVALSSGPALSPLPAEVLQRASVKQSAKNEARQPNHNSGVATPAAPCEHAHARILVVDDSALNRKMLTKLFKTVGQAVEEAVDGQDAVNKVKRRMDEGLPEYDTILMDFVMVGGR